MTCSEISLLLPEYSIDMLDARETALVQQHLATGCETCQCAVDEFRLALAAISGDLQPVAPPPEVKKGLLDRLAAEPQEPETEVTAQNTFPPQPAAPAAELHANGRSARPSFLRRVMPYAAAASVAFMAGWVLHSPANRPSEARYQREAAYEAYMARMLQSFDRSEIQLANFSRSIASPETFGAVVLDALAGELHLMFHPFHAPDVGSVFFAWARLDDGRHVAIGRLTPDESGQISGAMPMPQLPGTLRGIVVTSEPFDSLSEPGEIAEPSGVEEVAANFAK